MARGNGTGAAVVILAPLTLAVWFFYPIVLQPFVVRNNYEEARPSIDEFCEDEPTDFDVDFCKIFQWRLYTAYHVAHQDKEYWAYLERSRQKRTAQRR
jgi:hypothetical protein